ncbi:MAG TPA: hypothetical protein VF787_19825 [Thermoanaerobaculia bacterium]
MSASAFEYRVPIVAANGETQYVITNDRVVIEFARTFGDPAQITQFIGTTSDEPLIHRELEGRLSSLETHVRRLATHLASLDQNKPAQPTRKKTHLSHVREEDFTIVQIYDDDVRTNNGRIPKWNIKVRDEGGLEKRLGTFDSEIANQCKAACRDDEPVRVTFGMNKSGFFDIISVQSAGN